MTKPVAEVKIGLIVASIWENKDGEHTRHNVTFARLYKKKDEQWKRTASFGHGDLLTLAKVADLAHSKIAELIEAK
jgi:hypothetical protein